MMLARGLQTEAIGTWAEVPRYLGWRRANPETWLLASGLRNLGLGTQYPGSQRANPETWLLAVTLIGIRA